jgi:PEP-CTERM motif
MSVRATVLLGATLVWLSGAPAWADYISWTTPDSVISSKEGHMRVRVDPRGTKDVADGDHGSFVAANLFTEIDDSLPVGRTENFDATLHLLLTFSDGTHDASQVFTATLGGSLTKGSNSSDVTLSDLTPPNTQLTLPNGDTFWVKMFYTPVPPDVPSSPTQGAIGGKLLVQFSHQGGSVAPTPEPGTLVLAGLGLSVLGLGGWWRRARAARP